MFNGGYGACKDIRLYKAKIAVQIQVRKCSPEGAAASGKHSSVPGRANRATIHGFAY